jgi:hypothetical protein
MMSRPAASISFARASTENAVSVPRRATPAASDPCVSSTGGAYARGFTEFTWDGRTGYGMTEYIERVEDGVPVGYPL